MYWLFQVATIAAVKQLLLETLNDLSYEMLEEFREFLQMIVYQKNLPDISWMVSYTADTEETVDLMVQTYGQQSVELTMEVFMDMNRPDLMQRLSEAHSALKGQRNNTKTATLHNHMFLNKLILYFIVKLGLNFI